MCGIVGFTNDIGNAGSVIESMMDRIRHRGPDAEGVRPAVVWRPQTPRGGHYTVLPAGSV